MSSDDVHHSAELGYADDAIDTKVLNLAEGANFDPAFLKIVGPVSPSPLRHRARADPECRLSAPRSR